MKRRTLLLIVIGGLIIFSAVTHRSGPVTQVSDPYGWYRDNEEHLLVDLHVPDSVVSYGSAYHVQIPATGVSLVLPPGYERNIDFKSFSRDKDSCINVIEDHSAGIAARRKEIDSYVAYVKHDHWRDESVIYRKDFKFNGYDAFMVCVTDTTRTKTSIYMAFGDDRFNVSMTGTMAENTEEHRTEIVNTMLTAFYHKA